MGIKICPTQYIESNNRWNENRAGHTLYEENGITFIENHEKAENGKNRFNFRIIEILLGR